MRRKDDRKQESIKQALLKLILSEGLQGASIAKIAREAGVSPATVYIITIIRKLCFRTPTASTSNRCGII